MEGVMSLLKLLHRSFFLKDDKLHRWLFLLLRWSTAWLQPWSSTVMLIAPGLVKLGMWSCSGGFGCRMVIQKIQRGCCTADMMRVAEVELGLLH
jgi:hypothetical protein